ncbi:uncharacterized protein LOC124176887 [Neodiprion fabricii]|uniref:uncharacterized protein LOC124176887 n=1 Tax=Neodiprion fabricii TaxID=2872261 RepID=UPI001ED94AA8|nr:uncharacterized protein LOC124176887 [Neodiprion fabricii]
MVTVAQQQQYHHDQDKHEHQERNQLNDDDQTPDDRRGVTIRDVDDDATSSLEDRGYGTDSAVCVRIGPGTDVRRTDEVASQSSLSIYSDVDDSLEGDETGSWNNDLSVPLSQQQQFDNGVALPISEAPSFGDVCVKNSSNVHFGNKTFYNGPVTIKQIVYANPNVAEDGLVEDDLNRDSSSKLPSNRLPTDFIPNRYVDPEAKSADPRNVQDDGKVSQFCALLLTWRCVALMCAMGSCLVAAVVVSVVLLSRDSNLPLNPVTPSFSDSSTNISGLPFNNLRFVTRNEWGAQPPTEPLGKLKHPVPYVIISHTATEFCDTQSTCTFRVRFAQTFHIESRNWSDIAYNFLIGGDAYAYIGRGWDHVGAHAYGYNSRSIGISFIGTYNTVAPSDHQMKALQQLIEIGVKSGKIAADYKLLGHRQVSKTLSPGDALYNIITTWPHWSPTPKRGARMMTVAQQQEYQDQENGGQNPGEHGGATTRNIGQDADFGHSSNSCDALSLDAVSFKSRVEIQTTDENVCNQYTSTQNSDSDDSLDSHVFEMWSNDINVPSVKQQQFVDDGILLPISDAPAFGDVCIKDSTNVHIGNKTFYQGPVTIKQIVYAKSTVSDDGLGEEFSESGEKVPKHEDLKTSTKPVDPQNVQDDRKVTQWHSLLSTWQSIALMCTLMCTVGFCLVTTFVSAVLLLRDTELPSIPIFFRVSDWLTDGDVTQWWSFLLSWRSIALMCAMGSCVVAAVVVNMALYSQDLNMPSISTVTKILDSSVDINGLPLGTMIRFVTRDEWGAQPPVEPAAKLKHPVPYVIISHTATDFCHTQSSCVYRVRLVQCYHIESRNWYDIAYNFLIGGDGYVYIGRNWDYVGAHSYDYNARSIGISFIGTYNTVTPSKHQLHALQQLVDLGVTTGRIARNYKLLGHRQVSRTLSPGDALYNVIKTYPHWSPTP